MPYDTEGLDPDEVRRELTHETVIVNAEIVLGQLHTIDVQAQSANGDVNVSVDAMLSELATGGYLTDHIVKSYREMYPEVER